jgi:hypothetical protein
METQALIASRLPERVGGPCKLPALSLWFIARAPTIASFMETFYDAWQVAKQLIAADAMLPMSARCIGRHRVRWRDTWKTGETTRC